MKRIDVAVGTRFGCLKVLSRAKNSKDNRVRYRCICDCGTIKLVRSQHLRRGNTVSCGKCFLWKKAAGDKYSFSYLFKGYKSKAKQRNLAFELDEEQFRNITSANCWYCNAPPSKPSVRKDRYKYWKIYVYNGVDRLDSSLGYILGNCVPCCTICNRMKLDHSEYDFLEHIRKIANYKLELYPDTEAW